MLKEGIDKDTEQALELLSRLIATPSLSKEEGPAADIMEDFLRENDANVHRHKHNVWAIAPTWDPKKPSILLNSHLDTVPPNAGYTNNPYDPIRKDGKLYGLGSNDAGGALVSLAASFLKLSAWQERPYNLVFTATAEEEISGPNGISSLLKDPTFLSHTHEAFTGDKNKANELNCGVVGEPTQMRMAVAERGLLVIDCVAHGKAGHAARKEGENALYNALKDIMWLQDNQMPVISPMLGPVTWTATMIQTPNRKHNVIPDRCEFTIDIRIHEGYSHEDVLEILSANLTSELTPRSFNLRSSMISLDHPLISAGIDLGWQTYGSPTSSDKGRLPFSACKLGPGRSMRSHTPDEYIEVEEIRTGIMGYLDLLQRVQFPS